MTEQERRDAYLEWIKEYCRNDFIVDEVERVPAVIEIVIDEMIDYDTNNNEKQAESLGDYSVTFSTSDLGYNKKTLAKLQPYVKVRFR